MRLFLCYVALCAIVLYKLIDFFMQLRRQMQMLKSVPGPPKDNVIFGHVRDVLLEPATMIRKFMERCQVAGGIAVLWFCHLPFVFITKADFVEVFFTAKETRIKSSMYKYLYPWLGQGLLTSAGEKWQKHRKLITPAFHFSVLNSFCEKLGEVSEVLVSKIAEQEGRQIDVFEIMGLTTLDSLCETAMRYKLNALKNYRLDYVHSTEFSSKIMMERIFKPLYWIDLTFFRMAAGQKLKKNLSTIFKINDTMITDRRNEKASQKDENGKTYDEEPVGKKQMPFLDLLLEATESKSKSNSLSVQDLKDEVATFMFEGHETTTSALSFSLYMLGLHPEVQQKCFEELSEIFENSKRKPTTEDLLRMQYLEQVLKESLRLFPSVPLISREVTEDVQFDKYTIPKGTLIGLDIFTLHRDPRYFPDPEKFDPDRFSPANIINRHAFAYVPFAAGSRNCIGQKFAMMQMKIVVSSILRNFELESTYGRDQLKLIFYLTLRTKKSLEVKFKRRDLQNKKIDTSLE